MCVVQSPELQPYMLKGSLTLKSSENQRVETGEMAKIGWHGAQNGSAKAAKNFSQFLDGKQPWGSKALHHSGYVIFLVEDQMASKT